MKPTLSDLRSEPVTSGGLYLVERYLGAAAAERLPDAVARLAAVCAASAPGAAHVRYLHSTYLPSEDTCFCLFRAESTDAVRRVNGLADFAVDRITDAVLMFDAQPVPEQDHQQHQQGDHR